MIWVVPSGDFLVDTLERRVAVLSFLLGTSNAIGVSSSVIRMANGQQGEPVRVNISKVS